MSLLDSLLSSVLGGGAGADNNKTQMLIGLLTQVLSGTSSAPGAPSGLNGLLGRFQQAGMGNMVNSWVGTGANETPTPEQVHQGVGPEVIDHMSKQTGMGGSEISNILAQVLPQVVNHVTPNGNVPHQNDLQGMLSGLLGQLRR